MPLLHIWIRFCILIETNNTLHFVRIIMNTTAFKISLSKKQIEIISIMQKGYCLEHNLGIRSADWFWLRGRNGNFDFIQIPRISMKTVSILERKGLVVRDDQKSDFKATVYVLTDRGQNFQV